MTEEITHHRSMLLVHQNLDFEISLGQPNGAHDLEASKVRTEEDTSLAASQLIREYLESSYFDDRSVFPEGSIEFDHALIMRNLSHEWHGVGDLRMQRNKEASLRVGC